MDASTALDIINNALGLINEARISNIDPTALTGTERTVAQKVVPFYDSNRKQLLSLARWSFAKEQKKLEVEWLENGGTTNNGGEAELYHLHHGIVTGQTVIVQDTGLYEGKWVVTRISNDELVLDNSVYKGVGQPGIFAVAPPFGYQYQMELPDNCLRVHSVDGAAANAPARFWKTVGSFLHYNADVANIEFCADVEDVALFTSFFKSALTKKIAADAAMVLLNNIQLRNQYLQEVENIDIPNARLQNEIDRDEQPYERNEQYGQPFRGFTNYEQVELEAPGGSY